MPDYDPAGPSVDANLVENYAEEMGRGVRSQVQNNFKQSNCFKEHHEVNWCYMSDSYSLNMSTATVHCQAPAVSIARNKRSIAQANPALVGGRRGNTDKNANRDVTNMLAKAGMALRLPRKKLVPMPDW